MKSFLFLTFWACPPHLHCGGRFPSGAPIGLVLRTGFAALRPPHAMTLCFVLLCYCLAAQAPFFKMYDVGTLSNDRGWVLQADDEGFTIATGSYCDDLHSCSKLYRLDVEGNVVWEKLFNLYPYGMVFEPTDCLIKTSDGNLLASGRQYVESDTGGGSLHIFLMKIDINSGDSLWMRHYESNASNYTKDVIELPNSDIIVFSEGTALNDSTTWGLPNNSLLKTDSNGNIIWYHDYMDEWRGSLGGNMTILSTGEILLSYLTYDWVSNDPYPTLTKLTPDGEVIWSHRYYRGKYSNSFVLATETSNGHYLMYSKRDSNLNIIQTQGQLLVSKIDTSGIELEQKYIYLGQMPGHFLHTLQTTAEGVTLLGTYYHTDSDLVGDSPWLVKTDHEGNILWERTLTNIERDNTNDIFWGEDLKLLPDGRIAISMTVEYLDQGPSDSNAALMVLDSTGCFYPGCDTNLQWIATPVISPPTLQNSDKLLIAPNPTTSTAVIQWQQAVSGALTVIDLTGRVLTQQKLQNTTSHTLDCAAWPQGLYMVRVQTENGKQQISKLIIQH